MALTQVRTGGLTDDAVTTDKLYTPNLGRRNIVINGAMQVAQRGTSSTGLGATSGYFTLDRYKTIISGTAGRFTMSQDSDAPTGFANSLKIDCTTADTSIAASEYYLLSQLFEGYDVQQIKKGTSDAEKVTVSFYVKGNAAATYTCELEDSDNGRRNSQTFAVTTSWNRVVLTFNADTTGTFDNNNGGSLALNFWLHAGSTFTGGTFSNNSWGTGTDTRASSSQTSIFDSTDRTFFITGLQVEVGEQATPFEHRSFGEELALCQRYYEKSFPYATTPASNLGDARFTIGTEGQVHFKVRKRTNATMTSYGALGTGSNWHYFSGSWVSASPGMSGNEVLSSYYLGTTSFVAVSGQWAADAEL